MNTLRVVAIVATMVASVPAAAQTVTGPRVEVTAGWDQLRYDLSTASGTTRQTPSDLGYSVTAGYDREMTPTLVVGVEGSATFSQGDYAAPGLTTPDLLHVRRDLSAAARIGTRIGDSALLYGKIGYSNLQLGLEPNPATTPPSYARRDLDGVLLGVGVEVPVAKNTYVKSEYRYTNYEDGVARQNILTGIGIRF